MASKKPYFEPVDLAVDFPKMEKRLLGTWTKNGIVKKYLQKNSNSKKYFSFLDGPITANNPMGVHHAWGRTYKDLWRRYKNMQGFNQRFQNGFDCQGLWVEVEVEKELGFKSKKDIETFGVAKFVQLCRDRVKKYSSIQTEQSKRLGYFMDWDNSYYTLSDDNNYMIWGFLKKCHDNGWIYKGNDSVPWCPRCETAISQHEMLTEDYKEITHESVYLAFPVVGVIDEYFMVWTTTPWTIPANIAIAVDEKLEYSLVEVKKRKYWLAKDAVPRVLAGENHKVIKTIKGGKLVGLRYKGAFDNLPGVVAASSKNDAKFHNVVATDSLILPITVDEGTGLVHTAVSAGSEDFKLGKKLGLPMIPVINDDASYVAGLGEFSGLNAKKHPEIILDFLRRKDAEENHFFYKIEKYTHRYPACWRCKTELVWKVTDEWYISMDSPSKLKAEKCGDEDEEQKALDTRTLRERMKDVTSKINWIQGFGFDREMDWLSNMHDWLISKKNRYWGLALPIWECKKCGSFDVIGSKEELKKLATVGWKKFDGRTPHKPQIDEVKIKCTKCGSVMSRIEPVGNPWLDAGIIPYSTISENNKAANFEVTKTKPLYLTDKTKWEKWFPADFITESFPGQFKNWFYSLIAMSTVMEDTEPFKTVLGYATLFDEKGNAMHKSSGNMIEFTQGADKIGVDVMRWMFARQNPGENLLFGYRIADEIRRRFHLKIWNVYNFFVTYANLDAWRPVQSTKYIVHSTNVLDKWILARLNQAVQLVTDSLEKYDAYAGANEIEKFVDDLSLWYIRRSRGRVGPAAESENDRNAFYRTTYYILHTLSRLLAPFMPFISETLFTNLSKEESVHLSDWPDVNLKSQKTNHKLLEEMKIAREIVERAHSIRKEKEIGVKQPLNSYSTTSKPVPKNLEYLIRDEINVKKLFWNATKDEYDLKITLELSEEARVRDLVRKIQEERKRLGLNLTQQVDVKLERIPLDKKLVQWMTNKAQIKRLTVGKFKVSKASK
ncbi:MAG: Isoleucyl-tRNA synthetase [Microgenomates group bacterium GW2011_GWC1_39_7b]|uniref:Isoleucine--tRNA ligase n=3 Tax=Candidatus Woeseibacteriota TaxID=1752722 RepID=A0A0G0PQV3_9BACT|nr:MAG: Isoleucyl-tRNA synthetase [Candidatus Woesebacteria bacterium GW2011_GWB1_39_10]KKR26884.1 MAG: Isoleucyl-tRNA synthetase [Microgenomates group bacterium GW2011_GWC1_39_7b]KKR73913.1 MAG: Isoleucyl-tRNA synthetase [Candidatus Woesebacteria bacterium GW2011_GWA2_40_7]KKS90723.1 MAG: Isoleucyl-tRNA synthetase [Candidatus Woesebacteria bacterium GW2011_GWA1_43_12]